jgi:hypothetical protein
VAAVLGDLIIHNVAESDWECSGYAENNQRFDGNLVKK